MSAATNGAAARRDEDIGARGPASPAARSRAYRARRKEQQLDDAAAEPSVTPGAPSVTVQRRDGSVTAITFTAGLALASVSAGFSITGLATIFAGATLPVMAMAGCMEFAKIAATMWVARGYVVPFALKTAVVVLVVALMAITTIGVFGFLSAAHLAHVVAGQVAIDGRAAEVEARFRVATAALADVDERLGQVDRAVNETTKRGRTRSALDLIAAQAKNRAALVLERTVAATKLGDLEVETAAVRGEREKLAADSGPVRYLAELLHVDDAALMRVFILAIAALLDPLAIVLLLAAACRAPPARGG